MRICGSCYLASGFAAASVGTALFSSKEKKEFVRTLSEEQKTLFSGVVRRRLMIYLLSMLFGAGFAYAAQRATGASGAGAVCVSVLIMTGSAYLLYTAWPKGVYMLDHLTTRAQVQAWLAMYRRMMKMYHIGFALGLLAYAVLAWNPSFASPPASAAAPA